MPLPMKSTAKRLGNGPAAPPGLPHAGNDSIHGSAIVTPMPRRTVRLERLILFTRLEQQRCDFIQVAAPDHPRVCARTFVERVTNIVLRQKRRETLGRIEDAVLLTA